MFNARIRIMQSIKTHKNRIRRNKTLLMQSLLNIKKTLRICDIHIATLNHIHFISIYMYVHA